MNIVVVDSRRLKMDKITEFMLQGDMQTVLWAYDRNNIVHHLCFGKRQGCVLFDGEPVYYLYCVFLKMTLTSQ